MIITRWGLRSSWWPAVIAGMLSGCTGTSGPAPAVSEQEARDAVAEVITVAAQRSTAAMDQICDANDGCKGMSSSVRSDPSRAPGPMDVPEVLCVVGIPPTKSQAGSQLVVLEGLDGKGQPYVGQVLVDRAPSAGGNGDLKVQEPAFWLGIAYTALQGGRAWDTSGDDASERVEHDARARRACDDTQRWLVEVSGTASGSSATPLEG